MTTQTKASPKNSTQNPDNGVVRYNEKLGRFETYSASWDDLSSLVGSLGPIVGFQAYTNNVRQVLPQQNSFSMWQISYSKKQANTKLVIYANLALENDSGATGTINMGIGIGGISLQGNFKSCLDVTSATSVRAATGMTVFDNLPAGVHSIHFGWALNHSYAFRPATVFNPNHTDHARLTQKESGALVVEAAF